MRKREAIELYRVMTPVRLTGMTGASKMTVLTNLRVLRPVSEAYDKDMEQARDSCKPEGYAAIEERVSRHNEAIKNKTETGKMSREEMEEANVVMGDYYKELGDCERKILDEEVEIEIKAIDAESFNKLLEANDVEAGKLETLMSYLLKA